MDRDTANLEVVRLLEHYRSLSFAELQSLADQDAIESRVIAHGEEITLSVEVRHCSDGALRINVCALGNNWWKTERIDESVLVRPNDA